MLALFYDLTDDYLERRGALREEHLAMARDAHERGDLLLAGAFSDPYDQSLFVWATDDEEIVSGFAESDPYVRAGLVTGYQIRNWNVAIGNS
jgi:uncharacterized protein YciI